MSTVPVAKSVVGASRPSVVAPTAFGLAAATVATAVSIVLASKLGTVPVAVVSVIWFAVVAWQIWRIAHRIRSAGVAGWILAASAALAALRLTSAGLIQVVGDRPTLFWNVDWRYAATQGQGIARFGNLEDSLDYAGTPVAYHVGPAWIAGALGHVAHAPVNAIALIAIPIASTLVITVCCHRLLRQLGATRPVASIATAVLLSMSSNPYALLRTTYGSFRGQDPLHEVLTNAEMWWFSPNLMHNSLFALAAGLSAICLLLGRPTTWRVVLGALGVASLLAIKPQYAVGFLAVIGLGLLAMWGKGPGPWRRILGFGLVFVAFSAVVTRLNHGAISFVDIRLSLDPGILGNLLVTHNVLLIASLIIVSLVIRRSSLVGPGPLRTTAIAAVLGTAVLACGLFSTELLVDPALVAQSNALGLPQTVSSQDSNLDQALLPPTMLIVLLASALMAAVASAGVTRTRWVTGLAATLVAATLPLTVAPLVAPTGFAAYEVAEEPALNRLMALTDRDQGLWLSNDLADPADDYARPLRATNLTGFSTAQFYVSNLAYMSWTEPDAVERLNNVQRFFLTEWSPWHQEFMVENSIDHVVIHDRCAIAWQPEEAGTLRGQDGAWTLVERRSDPEPAVAPASSSRPLAARPTYGLSGCLGGTVAAGD